MIARMSKGTANMILIAALIAGISFYVTYWVAVPPLIEVVWKGSGVALLAAWAFARKRPWIGAVLAFGALGDVLLETHGLIPGAVAFMSAHAIGTALYWRYTSPRIKRAPRAILTPLIVTGLTAGASYLITEDPMATVYGGVLGVMAGVAMLSPFPIAALGTLSFIASDLFLFAGLTNPERTGFTALVWPTYFAAQALVAWGVVRVRFR